MEDLKKLEQRIKLLEEKIKKIEAEVDKLDKFFKQLYSMVRS